MKRGKSFKKIVFILVAVNLLIQCTLNITAWSAAAAYQALTDYSESYTPAEHYEIIEWKDPEIERAVREKLFGQNSEEERSIMKTDALQITGIGFGGVSISSLDDLKYLKNLNSLSLNLSNSKRFPSLSPIAELEKLEQLWLKGCEEQTINSLTKLHNLPNLKTLSITESKMQTAEPISRFYTLERLILSNNNLTDISSLKRLTKITYIDISNNYITNIDCMERMNNLKYVSMEYNQIKDLSPLSGKSELIDITAQHNAAEISFSAKGMDKLRYLNLNYNKLDSLGEFGSMPSLYELHLRGNNLKDISGLSGMCGPKMGMGAIDLSENQITDISALSDIIWVIALDLYSNPVSVFSPLHGVRIGKLRIWATNISRYELNRLIACNKGDTEIVIHKYEGNGYYYI